MMTRLSWIANACLWLVTIGLTSSLTGSATMGQDPGAAPQEAESDSNEQQARYDAFEKMLSGKKLVGRFTITGQDMNQLREEEYLLQSVKKIEDKGDYWMFKARVKYGDKSVVFPFPLEVKWAGDTPMITLTDFSFLGEGPFSARVLFHDGMYAGTWSHGDVTGHLFGKIVDAEAGDKAE